MEEDFRCRAINDYYASVTDELDLKEGAEYTIMQTSPSGWWYAVNDEGEDGWVPSNYLVRVDEDDEYGDEEYGDEDYGDDDDGKAYQATATTELIEDDVPPPPAEDPEPSQPVKQSQPQSQPQAQPQSQPKQQKKAQKTVIPVQHVDMDMNDGAPDKPITDWNVDETLGYLKHAAGLSSRNDFKLTQACRYLTQLATKGDQCGTILAKSGLDVVFTVMQATAGDVAIQMSCCAAAVVLCANPASVQYHATINGIHSIAQGIRDNMNYRPFVILAFNAVCNFCHNHPLHRSMALDTDIVSQVVAGMNHHRGKQEGYRVHSAGCLALRNIAADPKGQGTIGPDGVAAIIAGLEEYRTMREVVEGSMGVLCNLCALAANGEAFVMQGGLQLLDNLYSDPDSAENVRVAAASVLHNLAANQDTALLLSADQGIDLLVKIIKHADVDSVLFLNTLKVLAALLFKLPEDARAGGNKKSEVMLRILNKGIVASLNEALQYDNKELQEICSTLYVVIAQTNPKLAQALADHDAPVHLIPVCFHEPTPQTLHCSMAIFFHVCDAFQNQKNLVEGGVMKLLTSDWYKGEGVKEDTVRISCGVFIKLFSNVRNAQAIHEFEEGVQGFIDYNKQARPNLKDLCVAIEGALKQLDPMAGQMHVQESYKEVSNTQTRRQPEPQRQPEPEPQPEPQPEPEPEPEPVQQQKTKQSKEVRAIGRQSKMGAKEAGVAVQKSEPQAAAATGATHSYQPAGAPKIDRYYPYEELKANKKLVNGDWREAYLEDGEFQSIFGMDKDAFYKLRPWKQKQLKKQRGLW